MDVFLHIPKAAGTTIRTIISREYGVAETAFCELGTETFEHRDAPQAYLQARLAQGNVRLITGHLRFGIRWADSATSRQHMRHEAETQPHRRDEDTAESFR
jgi:hypothetical protein